jgi:hypothetical protein
VWLIDDTAGNGCLAVRVQFTGKPPTEKQRVAVGGAWMLDSAKQWYWKADRGATERTLGSGADRVTNLPDAAAPDVKDAATAPGFTITAGPAPSGARTISQAKDNDVVYFQIVGAPKHAGDGWQIADELGNPPVAILMLPGEQLSYGSIDLRTADERWALRRGVTYWLRIGRIRKPSATAPWQITARTAPVREM